MLPARHRLRRRAEFRAAARSGRRVGRRLLVVTMYRSDTAHPARFGFVVGKSVGGAVVRNTVRRRLRHLVRQRLDRIPDGALVIVRALPAAATAASLDLAEDLDAALDRWVEVEGGRPIGGQAVSR